MKPEVRLWKTQAKEYVPMMTPLSDSHLFQVDMIFFYNFFYLNGKMKNFDSQNLMKVLCDCIAEKNGFRADHLMKFGSWESYHSSTQDRVKVTVSQITEEEKHE